MKETFKTSEYSDFQIKYRLSPQERAYLNSLACKDDNQERKYRFHFEEFHNILRFNTLSWVGVIELESLRIEIRPKFDERFTSLIDLICFVNRLPFHRWQDNQAVYARDDFMELLVQLFLSELDKLIKHGLVKEYVTDEDNLRQLRGRPVFDQNLKRNLTNPTRIYCKFDELESNVPENQVILSALEMAYHFKLQPSTKRQVNKYRCEFEKVCSPYSLPVLPSFTYHRLNAHYEKAHRLCSYILRCSSVSEIFRYQHVSFFSLLVDMNNLFEQFVAELLNRYLPDYYRLTTGKRIRDAVMCNGNFYREIKPDLVITNRESGNVAVLDAKYKHYGKRQVDTADIFQVSFYAQYFNRDLSAGHKSIIVYPLYPGDESKRLYIDLIPGSPYYGSVKVKGISIEKMIESVKNNRTDYLKEQACSLITEDQAEHSTEAKVME